MKIINTALIAVIFFLYFASTDAEIDSFDIIGLSQQDYMTPAQFHEIEAEIKADRLEKAWATYNQIERASLYDMAEYDVTFYKLEMEIDLIDEYVDSASLTMTALSLIENLEIIELDFVDSIIYPDFYPDSTFLVVDSVYNTTGQLLFSHENNKIVIELDHPYNIDEEFSLTVRYHGHPWASYRYIFGSGKSHGRGLAFGYQNHLFDESSTIPVAYTDCQPYDSRRWWPCKDSPGDKADSMNINITVDEPYYCATNGRLDKIEILQGSPSRRTFKYRMTYPIYTSVVALAISEYTIWTDWYFYNDDNDSMPIVNYVYPYFLGEAQETWDITPQCLEIYADAFGEYAFIDDKYGHAQYENYGMEHQTCTAMPPVEWAHSTEYLIIHEMAHQWWGDMITCETWHDVWLNEGMATYSEAIYYEGLYGINAYRSHMASIEYWDDRSVYVYDTTNASNVFNIVVYHKGAWVMHMLRGLLGDELFLSMLRAYGNSQFRYRTITTEGFISFCNSYTGLNLDQFFDDWVYGIMYPVYAKAIYIEPDLSDGQYWTCLNLSQTQTYGPDVFEMPVDLRFYSGTDIILDTTINNDSRFQRFAFKTTDEPDSLVIDPDNWILNESFNMPWSYYLLPLPLDSADQYGEYRDTIICQGGSGYNQFQIISGVLPNGLTLNSETGEIYGNPEESGEFSFVAKADDTYSSYSDQLEFNIYIREGLGRPGDANKDENVDILDVVFLINYKYKDGPVPAIPVLADPNADCTIDILDIVYLINYRYKDGPVPQLGCAVIQ